MGIELTLSGFQSIRHPVFLTLEGLTVIEGESNLGKSALVRLIHAAFSNKSGTYYISTGEEKAILEWRDLVNHLVWEKLGSSTTYTINQKVLHKPGRGVVPDEVSRVGIREIRTSDKHRFWPQIQFQGEPPFLISERSPAIAAELLGSSRDLLTVSRALRLVRADVAKGGARLQALEEQSQLISERTRLLEAVYTASAQVYRDLEASFNVKTVSQQKQDTLTGLVDRWSLIQKQEQVFHQVQGIAFPVSPDTQRVQGLDRLFTRYLRIQYVLRASRHLVSLGATGDQIADRFQRLYALYQRSLILSRKLTCLRSVAANGIGSKSEVQGLYQRHQDLQRLQDRYLSLSRSRTTIENSLIDVNKKLKDLDQESRQLRSLVRELESCPFCEAPLHEGKYCASLEKVRL